MDWRGVMAEFVLVVMMRDDVGITKEGEVNDDTVE